MPLFEYLCPRCGERREVLTRSGGAVRPPSCPACRAVMEKQFSPVAAHTRARNQGCSAPGGGFS
ncbi:MAG: FmdB family zinc ribbon protein [Deferrisomatales bacterium]